jgi:membrane protein implicated in regulation of membrane protease activity
VRGIVAFFAVGGWVGLAIWSGLGSELISLVGALAAGMLALVFAAFVISWAMRMQDDGNLDIENAIESMATVYIPVPPLRSSVGRVTLTLQERFVEFDAVTDSAETLKTGEPVRVVGVQGGNTLVIEPVADGEY